VLPGELFKVKKDGQRDYSAGLMDAPCGLRWGRDGLGRVPGRGGDLGGGGGGGGRVENGEESVKSRRQRWGRLGQKKEELDTQDSSLRRNGLRVR